MINDGEGSIVEQQWAAEADEKDAEGEVVSADEVLLGPGSEASDSETELRQQVADLKDQQLRSQAELVNFRRRAERDKLERIEAARASVVRALLPAIDDLDRAIGSETDNIAAYRDGVELILRSLHEALGRIGVVAFDPQGDVFDPNLHEAAVQVPSDEVEPGYVVEVYKPGYRIGERLLRPAVVSVSSGSGATPEDDN